MNLRAASEPMIRNPTQADATRGHVGDAETRKRLVSASSSNSSLTLTSMRKSSYTLARRALQSRNASTTPLNPPVQVTTLPNRLRVATESTPGHFSSVGLYIDAGSRYENPSTSGVSHIIDRMAFKVSTTSVAFNIMRGLADRRCRAPRP